MSRIASLVEAAEVYHLDTVVASAVVDAQIQVVRETWDEVCDEAHLTALQRSTFFGRQFLNPSVFED